MPLHPVYNDTGPDVSNKKRQKLAQSCAGIAGLTAGHTAGSSHAGNGDKGPAHARGRRSCRKPCTTAWCGLCPQEKSRGKAGARAHGQKRDQRTDRTDRTWDCRRLAGKGGDKGRPGQSGSGTGVPANRGEAGGEPLRDARLARTTKPVPCCSSGRTGGGFAIFLSGGRSGDVSECFWMLPSAWSRDHCRPGRISQNTPTLLRNLF